MILRNAFFSIKRKGQQPPDILSDHVQELNLETGRESQDDTTMGQATRTMESGLKTWSLTATLKQDHAAGEVDAVLFDIYNSGDAATITVRPDRKNKGADNPEYTGQVVLESYAPLGQSVGDFHAATVQFAAAGDLTRDDNPRP